MSADRPLIGVLALQGDVREHLAALTAAGARATPVRRESELSEVDGIVLPGGESTTMSRLLATFGLLDPLRARLADGLPAYGSCAGMILLADKALDGRADQHQLGGLEVTVRRNAFGRQVDSFEADLDFDGIDGPLHAVFIRAPWVESVSANVRVLATVPDTPAAGAAAGRIVAVAQGNVLATSFHPELTGDARVHRLFVDLVHTVRGRTTTDLAV
ncbi:pyridoxal 5'-phosphate synthase glutaminase subunit PdxT [Actinokineospora sp. NBRC 105648]|uniref:pyridoxal 5'-phosphate synthase glutaminase subunit PdxT n=1 Tax=Actinokineospora sp. NBRC 105648 TaxID=3032206 RepID=UPI0024A0FEE9|nr:pyridoxal 5'-phosphate synthase glutaminase subunit PdxT [Actinokineospora sp. NBRC 105648]GLZ43036.1 pyridoxal 5'-phosphate synthase subunit PdxT [Actinokineospora sp. NBRC 105648]